MDDANLHAERLQLWTNFNYAWLALGYAQKEGMLASQRPTGLLTEKAIFDMVDELVRLCSAIERHGLVDYEMGVREEDIVKGMCTGEAHLAGSNSGAVFHDCMELFPESEDRRSSSR